MSKWMNDESMNELFKYTVDRYGMCMKLKEKGKNVIDLNGGGLISGYSW